MIRECDGYVDDMSYWTFSDVFEEQGIVKTPFYGGFGLIAERNIHKPAFNAFALLHRLGSERLPVESTSALATRTPDGRLVLALWNYAPPVGIGPTYHGPIAAAEPKHFSVKIDGTALDSAVHLSRLDAEHGNAVGAFDAMGRPPFPSRKQIDELRAAGQQPAAEQIRLQQGRLEIDVPAHGLVLVEIDR
jgi:xylan 1,4-beta-xylosidase